MKVKRIIYTDLHLGSGNFAWPGGYGGIKHGPDTRVLGDFEFKNILYKDVDYWEEEYKKHLIKSRDNGAVNVAGNHCGRVGKELCGVYDYIDDDGTTLYTHNHRVVYSKNKADKWENRKPGSGFWKVAWIRSKNGKYKPSKNKTASISLRAKMAAYAKKRGVKRIICGHHHFIWQGLHDGIEIYICGRGETILTLDI